MCVTWGHKPVRQDAPLVEQMRKPNCPTPEEVACHELTRLPATAWCEVCVKCRGREAPHQDQRTCMWDSVLLVTQCDYGYLTDTKEKPVVALFASCRSSTNLFRQAVHGEGTERHRCGCCLRFLDLGTVSRTIDHSERRRTRHSYPGCSGQRQGHCRRKSGTDHMSGFTEGFTRVQWSCRTHRATGERYGAGLPGTCA